MYSSFFQESVQKTVGFCTCSWCGSRVLFEGGTEIFTQSDLSNVQGLAFSD